MVKAACPQSGAVGAGGGLIGMVAVTFVLPDGTRQMLDGQTGDSLLDIAWDNHLPVEGACGGVMACSTCHMIVDPEWAGKVEPPGEEEDAILDLAWGVTATSRLGCQIVMTDSLDGLVVALPSETHDLQG